MKPTGVLLTAEEIGRMEGSTARWAREKYRQVAEAKCNGDYALFVRRMPTRGGHRVMFDTALLEESTRRSLEAADNAQRGNDEPKALAVRAGAQILPFDGAQTAEARPDLDAQATVRQAWATARKQAISPLLTHQWKVWRGQTFYGITIQTMADAVAAIAADSHAGNQGLVAVGSLIDWSALNTELASATGISTARLSPVSASTLWRWYSWHESGREIAGRVVCGLPALAPHPRADAATIQIGDAHAQYLTACYLGGDESVTRKSLALERPRSAAECLAMLKLEIDTSNLPGPAPSYYQVQRWVREVLPRLVIDFARLGKKRALQARGPHLIVSHAHQEVNDRRDWDFRRSNVMCWLQADGRVPRLFACGALDEASRDLLLVWDLYPSAQLFKSTLRAALLKWGVAKEEWMDNGKEFTCHEILFEESHEWQQRFEVDEEACSIFDHLHCEAHYCLKENPNGKALLERAFKNLDAVERNLPGWCGEHSRAGVQDRQGTRAYSRPERLKYELRLHKEFCEGKRPDTPLLHAWLPTNFDGKKRPGLIPFLTNWLECVYRNRKHRGEGMLLRAPAQVQAAFSGVRQIPNTQELDVLLWHRQQHTVHGDTVSFRYRGRTLHFRNEQLLALPGDCECEVHVDPLNADRALAKTPQGWIVLEPVNPTGGKSTAELTEEIHRQASLNKLARYAALAGSRLSPVPGPQERMEMQRQAAVEKQEALASFNLGPKVEVELAEYAGAVEVLQEVEKARPRAIPMSEERVFTSRTEYEQYAEGRKEGV